MKPNLLVILGPTATGKSDFAVKLAKEFNGEIISADSRQVYKGLDIGTGKITKEEMQGVPHHLLDVADPNIRFSVEDWKQIAAKSIEDIHKRGKLPIICGGTGYYISALVLNLKFPSVISDPEEQILLESRNAEELMAELMTLDPIRAKSMSTNGEQKNKRRLARAILIARTLGAVPARHNGDSQQYDPIMIGLTFSDDILKKRIRNRLTRRIETGMIEEAKKLHEGGMSFARMEELGLEYKYLAQYLQNKITLEEMTELLSTKIWQFARRQRTWWRKDKKIVWIEPNQSNLDKMRALIAKELARY